MEAQLSQSTATSQKCEREYITLRDAVKHLSEGWRLDVERLKKEMNEREAKLRKETEEISEKYRKLLEQVDKERESQGSVKAILAEERRIQKEWEETFGKQLNDLRGSLQRSEQDSSTAEKTARYVQYYFICNQSRTHVSRQTSLK